jgi:PIN domain nuclease of toxin-antitoxin system
MAEIAVLDTSALMAVLRDEPGAVRVAPLLESGLVSSVNLAEVQTKLVLAGLEDQLAWWHIDELKCQSVPFDDGQALIAGSLARTTKPYGLSLGDRACLALAIQRKATVYTTDAVWKNLDLGV